MVSFFTELFNYNHHINQKLIELMDLHYQQLSERSLQLMNHIINAHQIWNARIESGTEHNVWQMNNWQRLLMLDKENVEKSLRILQGNDLQTVMNYKNTNGQPFANTINDILFHVVNHSTYHRAQIAADLKQHNITPLVSDYIFYKRALQE